MEPNVQTLIPLARLIALLVAAKRTGFTRDGRVTVESTELHRAAASAGGVVGERTRNLNEAITALGGERVANGHRGRRYAFDISTIASIESQFKEPN